MTPVDLILTSRARRELADSWVAEAGAAWVEAAKTRGAILPADREEIDLAAAFDLAAEAYEAHRTLLREIATP